MNIEKLLMSKAIMDKTENIKRGQTSHIPSLQVENFETPNAKYNIPQGILENSERPITQLPNPTKTFSKPSVEAIQKSKLPDEIKRLMIEHPIDTPNSMAGPTLSDELIEKASRLMNKNLFSEQPVKQSPNTGSNTDLKQLIKEAVVEVMRENSLLVESTEKTNDLFKFQVGKHIFEGKLTKIKKLS